MRQSVLTVFLLCLAGAAAGQVYKWVDENGVTHYSDQPMPGAEQIDLPRSTTTPRPAQRPAGSSAGTQSQAAAASAEQARPAPFSYESISFTNPAPEQTLWNIGGVLSVSLNVQPGLQDGHRVRVYFDGELTEATGQSFEIQEVWRGTHNLQAEVVDETGRVMIRSEPMRFYVQQTSILN